MVSLYSGCLLYFFFIVCIKYFIIRVGKNLIIKFKIEEEKKELLFFDLL